MRIYGLENVKEGDQVAILHGGINSWGEAVTVTRTTPTQIIVGKTRYRRKNGYTVGRQAGWDPTHLVILDDRTKAAIAHQAREREIRTLAKQIRETNLKDLPLDTLRQIVALIEPAAKEASNES